MGIALGGLDTATKYSATNTRAWPYGGDVRAKPPICLPNNRSSSLTNHFTLQNKEKASDEFYILSTYGNFLAHARAATALADRAGERVDGVYAAYAGALETRAKLTPAERGELAEWVASAKIVTTDTGLRITAGIFEVTGAKSTANKVGLDRFWRDIRTHSLHDPVAYKNRELGRYQLLGEVPEPTWYT